MKLILLLTCSLITAIAAYGQVKSDTSGSSLKLSKSKDSHITDTTSLPIIDDNETRPQFEGGIKAFANYIVNNLKYPEVAQLIGINGKLTMQFVIERDGSVAEAKSLTCIGAGCEAEAVRVLTNSPKWKPGTQGGQPVRVQYTVPISFHHNRRTVTMQELRKSDYGFLFLIKGKEYSIDQAEQLLGKEFLANTIIIAEEQYDEQHKAAGKKATYLLKIEG